MPPCLNCYSTVGFTESDDGFSYCSVCGAQAPDIFASSIDVDTVFNNYSNTLSRPLVIAAEPISQVKPSAPAHYFDHPSILFDELKEDDDEYVGDDVGLTQPSDFGSSQKKDFSYEEYYSAIRSRYLCGVQIMIQLQCRVLVERFNVSPLIVGLVGPIWLRLLASSRVMSDDWAEKVHHDSETQTQDDANESQPRSKYRSEPSNFYGRRLVMIWYNSISTNIPKFYSLAISFLACHVAREAILPTDILKWSLEENLPYFAAFSEIEKNLGPNSDACPISAYRMFRPIRAISSQKLESVAADIAKRIGLDLPPVNFYAIASRYCRQLSLPTEEILPMACRICEWSMPPELYLSSNEYRIPTRAFVMSILIVAIRILFDINGYGMWESSLSTPSSVSNNEEPKTESDIHESKLNVVELLQNLEAKYKELDDEYDYSSDCPSYLNYCKDVLFSGLEPNEPEEKKLIKELWDFYNKDTGTSNCQVDSPRSKNKRSRNATNGNRDNVRSNDDESAPSTSQSNSTSCSKKLDECSRKERAIRQMKLDMEENKFCYISPRTKVKRKDYLHYARRRKDVYIYAVHADYYVLLRSCAKVAQVETRNMHIAVLSFERRLNWLEKRIDESLHYKQDVNDVCDFCCDESVEIAGIG
ncbi:hypothetical protein RD792_013262 [Penstemon davidsonii]|uniref:TATA box-binding protein-associated factor RNA polymerase I subunit B n=1 Tax=Penstemon davidsonii TaxID=160366 RepID=A0ABR0CTH5_9LAMI|nr:hypothetical protein RD792_013262 [Penstemon davidsonii]